MLISNKPKIFDIDLFGLAALLAIAILSWILLMKPLDEKALTYYADQQKLQQESEQIQQQLTSLEQTVKTQQMFTQRVSQTASLLSKKSNISNVLTSIGKIARESEIQLNEVTPGDTLYDDNFQKTSLNLLMSGSFPGLYQFLTKFRNELPFARIHTFTMNLANNEDGYCDIAIDLVVFTTR